GHVSKFPLPIHQRSSENHANSWIEVINPVTEPSHVVNSLVPKFRSVVHLKSILMVNKLHVIEFPLRRNRPDNSSYRRHETLQTWIVVQLFQDHRLLHE